MIDGISHSIREGSSIQAMTTDGNKNNDCLESFSRSIDEALRTVQNLHLSQLATAFYQASALQWALAVRLNRSQWINNVYSDASASTVTSQFNSYNSMFQLGSYDYHKANQTALPTPGTLPAPTEDAQSGPIDLTNAPNPTLPPSAGVAVTASSMSNVVTMGSVQQPPRKRQRRNSSNDPSRVRFHVVLLESSVARERPTNNKVRQLTACGLGRPSGVKEPLEMSVFTSASDLKDRLTALYPDIDLRSIAFDACYADKDGQLTVLPLDSFRYLATAIGDEGCLYLRPKVDISTAQHKSSLGQANKDMKMKRTPGEKNVNGTEAPASSLLDPSVRDQIVLQTRWRGSCTRRTHICECDICGVKFTRKDSLTRHSRKHSGKSYECKACGKCFAENYYYKRHKCRNVAAASLSSSNPVETKQPDTPTGPTPAGVADSAAPAKVMGNVSPSTVAIMMSNSPSGRSSVYNYDSSESVGVPCTSGGESGSSVSLSGEEKGE